MSNSTVAEPAVVAINLMSTFGAVLVGSFLSSILWGVSTFQVFLYFMTYYDSDSWKIKVLVAFLWACDTANEVLITKANFRVPILNWGDVAGINNQQLELMDHTVTEALVIILVQGWFIRRIYLFNKRRWMMSVLMLVLSSWLMIGTIVYLVFGYGRFISTLSTQKEVALNMTLRAAAVVVDVAISINMIYLLRIQHATLFKSSQRMVNRILLLSVNSSLVTAIFATATLILLATQPDNLYYCIPELSLCTVYFSSLLANLNARNYIKGEQTIINTFSDINFQTGISLQTMSRQQGTNNVGQSTLGTKASDIAIGIETSTAVKSDVSSFEQDSFPAVKHEMV
ncbi:hypothetical protein J3R30DRAFT_3429337 [Lentinula aciculospora]|uniref:DUF6534 domain-containing protein n=1 Tax=Lentinula aciculospora TaxID=153920 RepID=A0A9W9AAQ9_9AGAR|nr:hypothetical protein J3R30DRAFT_3482045 [Lentinula aciculospora]KAJ4487575.1 hypothetical protein J3R30DRAFT_3429337 [Lentinula aciculospora]